MPKKGYTAVSNNMITDPALSPSIKRVYITLLAYSGRSRVVRKTVAELSRLSHCSIATVQNAITVLSERGLVRKVRGYRKHKQLRRKVYATNAYLLADPDLSGGYTLIPRALLAKGITHGTFLVALYLYMRSGRKGRSYPSLRRIAEELCLARSTVCLALTALRLCQVIYRNYCVKQDRTHACNSYYPTDWVRAVSPRRLHLGIIIADIPPTVNGGRWSDF